MTFYLSDRSKRNRSTARDELIEISDLAITITPVDFGHGRLSAARNSKDQNILYLRGHSKLDGYTELSKHQTKEDLHPDLPILSNALDFFAYANGKAIWKGEEMAIVGAAFLQAACKLGYKVEWGGLWPWDQPHIQWVD